MSKLIEKYDLINEAEAKWVAARVEEGVPEADAVARLKAARVGPASLREDPAPARHVPGGEAPSRPTGGLTEAPPDPEPAADESADPDVLTVDPEPVVDTTDEWGNP